MPGRPAGGAGPALLSMAGATGRSRPPCSPPAWASWSLASLNPRTWGFLPLAVVSAIALWAWTILSGGRGGAAWRSCSSLLGGSRSGGGRRSSSSPGPQPHVVRLVARSYAEGRTGLSDRSELGEFRRLATSQRRVARVLTREPSAARSCCGCRSSTSSTGGGGPAVRHRRASLRLTALATLPPGSLLAEVPGSTFDLTEPRDGSSLGPGAVEARVLLSLGFDEGWGLLVPARTSSGAPAR